MDVASWLTVRDRLLPARTTAQVPAAVVRPVGSRRTRSVLQGPDGKSRINGLDLARGLAVIGMIGAHVGTRQDLSWLPSSWQALVYGRSAALFGVLAGVSIALLSGGTRPASGDDLVRARGRIVVRAACVFVIGGVLELLGTDIAVILTVYAILFFLALPFLQWSPRRLLLMAAGLAVIAPPVSLLMSQVLLVADGEQGFHALMLTGAHPALWWWVFVLVGLALGRSDLSVPRVRVVLLVAGAATAVAGYALGWLSTHLIANGVAFPEPIDAYERMPGWDEESVGQWDWAWLSGAQPHSGTPFWLLASVGFAAAVIAVCLVVADAFPHLSYPIASVGAMALTVYSLHVVAFWVFPSAATSGATAWLLITAGAVVFAVGWRLLAGRGPLERVLAWSSNRAAGLAEPTSPLRPPPARRPAEGAAMTSATGTRTERQRLRWSGALLLGGLILTVAVTMLFHPSGDEDVNAVIFAKYAASSSYEWIHLAQFIGGLSALGGLIILHQALRSRAPKLSAFGAGLTVATAAVWAVLQAVDGVVLKQAVDAWIAADGAGKPPRFASAETVRWTDWVLQSYFRGLLGAALLLFGAAILTTRLLAGWLGWLAALAGLLSVGVGVDMGYRGLDSDFQQIASPAFKVVMLAFAVGVVVAAAHGRVRESTRS